MIGIIICTHSNMAQGMLNSLEMIAGKQENITAISFQNGEDMMALSERIANSAKTFSNDGLEVIVFVDLYGASPFNASAVAFANEDVNIVTGVNLAMLLEVSMMRNSCNDAKTIVSDLENSAKESIKVVNTTKMFQ